MGLVTSCSAEKPSLRRVVCVHERWALPAEPMAEADGGPLALLPCQPGAAQMALWRLEGPAGVLDESGEPLALQLHAFAVLPSDANSMPETHFWTLRNPRHSRKVVMDIGGPLVDLTPIPRPNADRESAAIAIGSSSVAMALPPSSCMTQSLPSLLGGGAFLLAGGGGGAPQGGRPPWGGGGGDGGGAQRIFSDAAWTGPLSACVSVHLFLFSFCCVC